MSFADRLKKREPMPVAAVKPTKSMPVSLCMPRVLTENGRPVGLVNLVLSPMFVGGVESTRLLTAIEELLKLPNPPADELREAADTIKRHLDSLDAASELAGEEHDAHHQHEKELH